MLGVENETTNNALQYFPQNGENPTELFRACPNSYKSIVPENARFSVGQTLSLPLSKEIPCLNAKRKIPPLTIAKSLTSPEARLSSRFP